MLFGSLDKRHVDNLIIVIPDHHIALLVKQSLYCCSAHSATHNAVRGAPLSSYHSGKERERPFRLLTYALTRPREELYERINQRVELMIEEGLVEEAKALYPHRRLNALNTVGYKELFAHFEGQYDLAEAVRLIQRNSRHYARKQLTWQRRHPEFSPLDLSTPWDALLERISQDLHHPIAPTH